MSNEKQTISNGETYQTDEVELPPEVVAAFTDLMIPTLERRGKTSRFDSDDPKLDGKKFRYLHGVDPRDHTGFLASHEPDGTLEVQIGSALRRTSADQYLATETYRFKPDGRVEYRGVALPTAEEAERNFEDFADRTSNMLRHTTRRGRVASLGRRVLNFSLFTKEK